MQANRQWFGHRRLTSGETVRRHALCGIGDQLLLKRALNMRKRHCAAVEPHIQTVILLTKQAIFTAITWPRRGNCHKLAHLKPGDTRTKLPDYTRHLMTQNHWLTQPDRPKPAMLIIMQIRAADAASLHLNRDLPHCWRAEGAFFNPQIFCSMDNNRFH